MEIEDLRKQCKRVMRHTFAKELLIHHVILENNVKCRKALKVMNVWMRHMANANKLEHGYNGDLRLSKTGDRYMLSGRDCPLQTAQNIFEHSMEADP